MIPLGWRLWLANGLANPALWEKQSTTSKDCFARRLTRNDDWQVIASDAISKFYSRIASLPACGIRNDTLFLEMLLNDFGGFNFFISPKRCSSFFILLPDWIYTRKNCNLLLEMSEQLNCFIKSSYADIQLTSPQRHQGTKKFWINK